jgi:hypothetical protein
MDIMAAVHEDSDIPKGAGSITELSLNSEASGGHVGSVGTSIIGTGTSSADESVGGKGKSRGSKSSSGETSHSQQCLNLASLAEVPETENGGPMSEGSDDSSKAKGSQQTSPPESVNSGSSNASNQNMQLQQTGHNQDQHLDSLCLFLEEFVVRRVDAADRQKALQRLASAVSSLFFCGTEWEPCRGWKCPDCLAWHELSDDKCLHCSAPTVKPPSSAVSRTSGSQASSQADGNPRR